MKNTWKRCGILSLMVLLALGAASCGQETASRPELLEPPGLHWNASVDETLDALSIDDANIILDEETAAAGGGPSRTIIASGVSFWGEETEVRLLFTQNNPDTNSPPGLGRVSVTFPADADMQAIQAQMTKTYGEGSQSRPDDYHIGIDGTVQITPKSKTIRVLQKDGSTRDYLLDPSEHTIYWAAGGKSFLSEDVITGMTNYLVEQGAGPESADELIGKKPLVFLSWSDGNVLVDGTLDPQNQVQFDGRTLVQFIQISQYGGK